MHDSRTPSWRFPEAEAEADGAGQVAMRIAILSQYFPPDGPGRFADELSQELALRGHSVRVLTTFPHYDAGKSPLRGRQSVCSTEMRGAVAVRRVPIYARHSRNPLGRAANYLSFAWSATLERSFVKDADVVYVHGTPATVVQPAYAWAGSLGVPFVYCVQDIWPESVTGSGFLPPAVMAVAERIISRWLRRVYARAAAVIVIAPSAGKLLAERGAPADRVHLVYNWANEAGGGRAVENCLRGRGLRLLYAGNLGVFQDLETVLRAVARVSGLQDIRLDIAGGGSEEQRLRSLVEELGLQSRVRLLGRMASDDLAEAYERSDFQLVTLRDLEIFSSTIPSKFQAGLARGVPLITTVAGDISRLVRDHGLGFTAIPGDPDALAEAFRQACETTADERAAFRLNAKGFYDAHLTKDRAAAEIETILTSVARSRGGVGC